MLFTYMINLVKLEIVLPIRGRYTPLKKNKGKFFLKLMLNCIGEISYNKNCNYFYCFFMEPFNFYTFEIC